jgi:hypothetical protein
VSNGAAEQLMSGAEKHDLIRVPLEEATPGELAAGSRSESLFALLPPSFRREVHSHLGLGFELDWETRLDCLCGLGPDCVWVRSTLRSREAAATASSVRQRTVRP